MAHILLDYGLEDYIFFLIILEKSGELWLLPSRDLRGSTNFTLDRPSTNKEPFSVYLQNGSNEIRPIE